MGDFMVAVWGSGGRWDVKRVRHSATECTSALLQCLLELVSELEHKGLPYAYPV